MSIPDWGSATYGAVFLTVLAEYAGLPIPSSIALIVSGAVAARGHLNLSAIFAIAFVAATLGDALWFYVGRVKGEFFLAGYCALSLGSRDCVRRTKELFLRFPRTSLLLGKFVPGLSTFVVPVAGVSGMRYAHFFRDDGIGIVLWAFLMIAAGYWSAEWIWAYVNSAKHAKRLLLAAAMVILICYYGIKLWRLKKFGRAEMGSVG